MSPRISTEAMDRTTHSTAKSASADQTHSPLSIGQPDHASSTDSVNPLLYLDPDASLERYRVAYFRLEELLFIPNRSSKVCEPSEQHHAATEEPDTALQDEEVAPSPNPLGSNICGSQENSATSSSAPPVEMPVVVEELVVPHVSDVPPIEVVTGSTAELPRVSEDLCPDQARLVRFAEWHMELWVKDDTKRRLYTDVLRDFIQHETESYSEVRKAIYQARMDGSALSDMQRESFRYRAEEMAQEIGVSLLICFNSRFCALSQADQGMLGRMLNTSRFDAEFKKMRKAFAAGLLREVEVD